MSIFTQQYEDNGRFEDDFDCFTSIRDTKYNIDTLSILKYEIPLKN